MLVQEFINNFVMDDEPIYLTQNKNENGGFMVRRTENDPVCLQYNVIGIKAVGKGQLCLIIQSINEINNINKEELIGYMVQDAEGRLNRHDNSDTIHWIKSSAERHRVRADEIHGFTEPYHKIAKVYVNTI